MKPALLLPLSFCLYLLTSCGSSPAVADALPAPDPNADDSPHKIHYGCGCGVLNGGKKWFDKPVEATVNADNVLVRWHPFSPKILRSAQKSDKVLLDAYLDFNADAFTLLQRDTYALVRQDTVFLRNGRRGSTLWEDTVTGVVKVRFRDLRVDQDYDSDANDSNSFKVLLQKSMVEILPNTRWYYLKTKDGTDACIMGRYLDLHHPGSDE
jgi:hypothetical protein